jgi:hypothetical protein
VRTGVIRRRKACEITGARGLDPYRTHLVESNPVGGSVVAFFAPLVDENPVCITEEVRFAVDSPARGQDSKPPFLLSERQCRRMRDRSHAETND